MSLPLQSLPLLEVVRRVVILVIQCVASYLVKTGRLKVNYSRKLAHFSELISIWVVNRTFFNYNLQYFIISGTVSFLASLIFIKPIRERVAFLAFLFLSYDRPEDRPHTVRLTSTQILGMTVTLVGMAYLYRFSGLSLDLLAVPLMVTAFGDGLAEPVGIYFGKKEYQTEDLFGDRVYTRTYAGSTMVFLSALVTLMVFSYLFSLGTLIVLIAVLPLLMTLTEAYSPHTWDNPFLYLVGGLVTYALVLMF